MTTDLTTWLDLPDAPAIDGLRVRRPRGDDADFEAMADLVRAANGHDGIPYAPSGANLREEFEAGASIDPARDVVLVEVDETLVANAGVERSMRAGTATFELFGHVRPEWRRRGLGRALLAANLRRVAERAADEPAGRPVDIRSYVQEDEVAHRALMDAAGFEVIRWFFEMRRDLADPIEPVALPDGLEIRPVTPDLHRRIWDADIEAFRDHWQARTPDPEDFANWFGKADLDTSLWVVAWDGDEVAGVVQGWVWKDENAALGLHRGWLEHISVRRPWRRRGLARALTIEAMRRLREAGITEAMLGVDAENPTGALGLYEGLGFHVSHRAMAYRRPFEREGSS